MSPATTMNRDTRGLSVKLSLEAHKGWKSWSRIRGVSVTSLMEAIGQVMPGDDLNEERIVGRAREIDADRRSRSE